jgi:hypothetical protein
MGFFSTNKTSCVGQLGYENKMMLATLIVYLLVGGG